MADKKPVRKRAAPRAKAKTPARASRGRATAGTRSRKAAPPANDTTAIVQDLALAAEAPRLGDIPWGYGENRVTAMARDPSWVFVYWEVTDEALERARAEIHDPHGWCVLRVYDTTYRQFDGTNANWYVDVPVVREANNYYVPVHRPGATIHVDVGIKSHEGWFAKIARSAPVEMPRDSISEDARTEWMTVTPEGAGPRDYVHRFVQPPGGPPPLEVRTDGASDADIAGVMQSFVGEGWSRTEWTETDMDGRAVRWIRWTGPFWSERWRTMPLGRDATVEVLFHGERTVVRTAWGERMIIGPWLVTIHGSTLEGRRIVDRWAIHYSWIAESGRVRVETEPILGSILGWSWAAGAARGSEARLVGGLGASEWVARGASEWRWLGGSERRLGGASETLFVGASESRYLGASEMLGASERLFLGASGLLGASEALAAGARLGASEGLAAAGPFGASERLMQGGSERVMQGAPPPSAPSRRSPPPGDR